MLCTCQVDIHISNCVNDLSNTITTIAFTYQLQTAAQLNADKVTAAAAAGDLQPADKQDWDSLQSDLVAAVGGLQQLRQQLQSDQELTKQWMEEVTPMLQGMSVSMGDVHNIVQDVAVSMGVIKDGVQDLKGGTSGRQRQDGQHHTLP